MDIKMAGTAIVQSHAIRGIVPGSGFDVGMSHLFC